MKMLVNACRWHFLQLLNSRGSQPIDAQQDWELHVGGLIWNVVDRNGGRLGNAWISVERRNQKTWSRKSQGCW